MKQVLSKKKLEDFRGQLTNEMNKLVTTAREYMSSMTEVKENLADMTDQASADMDENFLHRIEDRKRKLILKYKEALQRIDDGTFGYCEICGEPIGEKRLKIRPVTTQCIECKTDMEDQERRMEA